MGALNYLRRAGEEDEGDGDGEQDKFCLIAAVDGWGVKITTGGRSIAWLVGSISGVW